MFAVIISWVDWNLIAFISNLVLWYVPVETVSNEIRSITILLTLCYFVNPLQSYLVLGLQLGPTIRHLTSLLHIFWHFCFLYISELGCPLTHYSQPPLWPSYYWSITSSRGNKKVKAINAFFFYFHKTKLGIMLKV